MGQLQAIKRALQQDQARSKPAELELQKEIETLQGQADNEKADSKR
jgi:gas vesicle protein